MSADRNLTASNRLRRHGFTMIELLVVIAIIAILASLLLPATGHAQKGTIGLGTWKTQAEFKDIEVIADGKTLYRSDFSTEAKDWKPAGGDWKVLDDGYWQLDLGENRRSVLVLPELANATDYTIKLKARKIDGHEGFLILFHVTDADFWWWNVGGWGNTAHGIERNRKPFGEKANGTIEPRRWYDIRIELADSQIKCFLDDQLILYVIREPPA